MKVFYEIIIFLFFVFTIFVGIFSLRWNYLGLDDNTSILIQEYLMPWYLLFCGLMVGYIISSIWIANVQEQNQLSVYIKSFVIWIILWVMLSIGYMFLW